MLFGGILTVIFSLMVFGLPRRHAAVVTILATCYLTQGINLSIGLNFTAIRIVLLAGFVRVISKGELKQIRFNAIDRMLVAYALCQLLISTVRMGTFEVLVYQLGGLYNIFLSYFVFRALLKEEQDVRGMLSSLAFMLVPLMVLMAWEANTGRNLFAAFSGVSEYSMFRDGHFRAEGAFRSPITAGAFGATLALLYSGMIFSRGFTRPAILGLAVSLIIAIPCARSSGPVLGLFVGILALMCWRFRQHTRKIRWGIAVTLFCLHMVMKSPVWFLLGRISDLVGGGGYHRAYIIDSFVSTFSSWWLVGMSDTSSWMPTQLESGGADITNQFVADGLNGGLIGFILSIFLLTRCFQTVGAAIRANEGTAPAVQRFTWALGAALVGNIGILISVTYFDQMHVVWYFLIACISAVIPETANVSALDSQVLEQQSISQL